MTPHAGEELEAVILDMDRVLEYGAALAAQAGGAAGAAGAARSYEAADVACVCSCAQRLLILACERVRAAPPLQCPGRRRLADSMQPGGASV